MARLPRRRSRLSRSSEFHRSDRSDRPNTRLREEEHVRLGSRFARWSGDTHGVQALALPSGDGSHEDGLGLCDVRIAALHYSPRNSRSRSARARRLARKAIPRGRSAASRTSRSGVAEQLFDPLRARSWSGSMRTCSSTARGAGPIASSFSRSGRSRSSSSDTCTRSVVSRAGIRARVGHDGTVGRVENCITADGSPLPSPQVRDRLVPPCQGGGCGFESRRPLHARGPGFPCTWLRDTTPKTRPVIGKPLLALRVRRGGRVVRQGPAKPRTPVRFRSPPRTATGRLIQSHRGRLAQWESASLTRKRSEVQIL